MRRRRSEVNTERGRSSFIARVVASTFVALALVACGGTERRAERLWRHALEQVEKGDTEGAVDTLQRLIHDYPDAEIAAKARDQLIVYQGLAHAVKSYPMRRARESMIQIARAIEAYKAASGRSPASLEVLVPSPFAELPRDPWDRAFTYESAGRGYRLRCQGADGASGGTGDAADLLVVNGEFVGSSP